ncbi:hypothetical protein V8E36_000154 [Tilletia maclaganii]
MSSTSLQMDGLAESISAVADTVSSASVRRHSPLRVPATSLYSSSSSQSPASPLTTLPTELLIKILCHLDYTSLNSLRLTCKTLEAASQSVELDTICFRGRQRQADVELLLQQLKHRSIWFKLGGAAKCNIDPEDFPITVHPLLQYAQVLMTAGGIAVKYPFPFSDSVLQQEAASHPASAVLKVSITVFVRGHLVEVHATRPNGVTVHQIFEALAFSAVRTRPKFDSTRKLPYTRFSWIVEATPQDDGHTLHLNWNHGVRAGDAVFR